DQIIFPTQAGGYAYTFNYNIEAGGLGEVSLVTLPSADQNKAQAVYTYQYGNGAMISDVLANYPTQKALTYLREYDLTSASVTETWTYTNLMPGGTSIIKGPDGSVTKEYSYGGTA